MGAVKRPSGLKRQKEQQRLACAAEKREAHRARKHSTGTEIEDPNTQDQPAEGPGGSEVGGD